MDGKCVAALQKQMFLARVANETLILHVMSLHHNVTQCTVIFVHVCRVVTCVFYVTS